MSSSEHTVKLLTNVRILCKRLSFLCSFHQNHIPSHHILTLKLFLFLLDFLTNHSSSFNLSACIVCQETVGKQNTSKKLKLKKLIRRCRLPGNLFYHIKFILQALITRMSSLFSLLIWHKKKVLEKIHKTPNEQRRHKSFCSFFCSC